MKRRTLLKGMLGSSTLLATGKLFGMSEDAVAKQAANAIDGKPQNNQCGITPQEIEGPFYPINRRQEHDIDLTVLEGHSTPAAGKVILINGRVLDAHCRPISKATVEIWQANTWGKYSHPRDKYNPAPSDPNFQGWGLMTTNAAGYYQFKTIVPGSYPVNPIWTRPPHIHFKVFARHYVTLTTQLYFAGEPLNQDDQLLMRLPEAERKRVITTLRPSDTSDQNIPQGQFDIILPRI